jgi:long-subunit acyl-CoA synthetase (AMP-forming)
MDLVSWIFGNGDYDQNCKIYIDPAHPTRSLTANEARSMVRKLVAGFKAKGLQKGDCVCLHAFNDVRAQLSFDRPIVR